MNALQHYDGAYYQSHYGRIWSDADYYDLQSRYWRRELFDRFGVDPTLNVLDYGSGLEQVSAALPRRACFDVSAQAREFMRLKGTRVFDRPEDIPPAQFDCVLCSHTLEHHAEPLQSLLRFRSIVKAEGWLVLALPQEIHHGVSLRPDSDRHFYAWTFQTISNLLDHSGWVPLRQGMVFGSFMLKTLGGRLGLRREEAVQLSSLLGRIRRGYPTLVTISRAKSSAG